jgi:hypothetical protein
MGIGQQCASNLLVRWRHLNASGDGRRTPAEDLPQSDDLDREAMRSIVGGSSLKFVYG